MAQNNNKSSSPNKFLSLLFGGKARRREQRAANEQYEFWLDTFAQQKMNNPYAGVRINMKEWKTYTKTLK